MTNMPFTIGNVADELIFANFVRRRPADRRLNGKTWRTWGDLLQTSTVCNEALVATELQVNMQEIDVANGSSTW
jgi:hypothetical protein